MPDKSRHGKGKYHQQSKKGKVKQRHTVAALPPDVAAVTPSPEAAVSMPSPVKASHSPAKSRTPRYPYITTELRSIGILAVIILAILIVLSRVLS